MSDIFPAATVVLVRDGCEGLEVLLLRRSRKVAFAGGSWVFPGGRIDAADYVNAGDIATAASAAAVREVREEAGLTLSPDDLAYFSHWTAPPGVSKRFATWFFIAVLEPAHPVVVDGSEIVKHHWYRPQEAIEAFNKRQITMMAPTFVTLTELLPCSSAAAAMAFCKARPAPVFKPKMIMMENTRCALYAGDAQYGDTARHDVTFSAPESQDRHRLWMSANGWVYQKNV